MSSRFDPDSVSNEELLKELRALSEKLGRTPSASDMKKESGLVKKVHLYRKRFGGLQEAQEKIGLSPNKGGTDLKIDETTLLEEILKIKDFIGKTPSQSDIEKHSNYSINAYKARFGTYNNALEKLNLETNLSFNINNDAIKNDIIRVSSELNRAPTVEEFNNLTKTVSSTTACLKLCGNKSWNDVLKVCGISVAVNKNLSEKELKEEVERLKVLLGRVPGYTDMRQYGKYSGDTYANHYGSFVEALKHFGYDYKPENHWHNQSYTKGLDETMYKSSFEANIANILYRLKTENAISSYEYEKKVCPERKWTCDFFVIKDGQSFWIEADGMGKNRKEDYNLNNEKIKYYKDNFYNFFIVDYRKNNLENNVLNIFGLGDYITTKIDCPDNEILSYNKNMLTKGYISSLSLDDKEILAQSLLVYFLKRDMKSYIISDELVMSDWVILKNTYLDLQDNKIRNMNAIGSNIYKKFFNNFSDIRSKRGKSLSAVLSDKVLLEKIIRNRLGITYKETFNITPAMIKQGAKSMALAAQASQFKPAVAKAIYKEYVKEGDNVLDFSCGYGSRLIGLMSLGLSNVKYFGYEPNTETFNNLMNLSNHFSFNVSIKNTGSENECFYEKMDFVFSSPPYFDKEIYSDEETQAYNRFKNYEDFLEWYWKKTVKNIKSMLKTNGIFALNAGNDANSEMSKIYTDFNNIVVGEGFELVRKIYMETPRSHLSKNKNFKLEPINFYKLK